MLTKNFDKIVINYFSTDAYVKITHKLFSAEKIIIEKYISKRNANILDLCCGNGGWSILLAKKGHNVIGVDFCPRLIQIARVKKRS